ncbi:hypothetical protein GYH30_001895 [Glycine max]|nr:hypothetical protein GYH30_001895 [Glycine max]
MPKPKQRRPIILPQKPCMMPRKRPALPNLGAEEDYEKQATQNMKYQAEDAASRATETMKSAASGASDYASQKATDAKEAVSGAKVIKMPTHSINNAKDTMGDTYEDAKQKMNTASDKVSSMAHNAKDNMEYGRDRAAMPMTRVSKK